MSKSVQRELFLPHPPSAVWSALTESDAMADWLMPNDFEPRVGHRFTLRSQPNPKVGFDGLIHCEVLVCDEPSRLVYSWVAAGLDTRVSYELEPEGDGTRLVFEQSGFQISEPWTRAAFRGAELGWEKMLGALGDVVRRRVPRS